MQCIEYNETPLPIPPKISLFLRKFTMIPCDPLFIFVEHGNIVSKKKSVKQNSAIAVKYDEVSLPTYINQRLYN
jgi:hypothetical protein